MEHTAAVVYWFTDRTPKAGTLDRFRLRKWDHVNQDLVEGNLCEGLWKVTVTVEKWIPCIILRLDSGKDAVALEKRYLGTPVDIAAANRDGVAATAKILKELKTTVVALRSAAATQPKKQPAKKSGSSKPTGNKAVIPKKRTHRFSTLPIPAEFPPRSPVSDAEPHMASGGTGPNGSAMVIDDNEGTPDPTMPFAETSTTSAQTDPVPVLDDLKQDVHKVKKIVIKLQDQHAMLTSKNVELEAKIRALERMAKAKGTGSTEDEELLNVMKSHSREAHAIRAALVHLFTEDGLIYGVLTQKGLDASPVAREILSPEKIKRVQMAMERWSAYMVKDELKEKEFRKKVTTILEAAKVRFGKEEIRDDDEENGLPVDDDVMVD